MSGWEFPLTRTLSYKDRVADSVVKRENMGQRKPVFWHIVGSDLCEISETEA